MDRASGVRRGRMAAGTLGILAGAALILMPAAPVAANPLCLDVLGLVELCLGGSPDSAPSSPQPSEPEAPSAPDPSTPPEEPSDPESPQTPESPEPAEPSPSSPPSPSAPSTGDSVARTIAPASSGNGSAGTTAPEAAPTPAPSATATPAPAQERIADASVPMIVIGDRGTPPAPGTVPMFAAGITLVGAGALATGGILFARKQSADADPGQHRPFDR